MRSRERPLRVLALIDSLAPGGAERSLAEMAPEFSRFGIEFALACLRRCGSELERGLLASEVPVYFVGSTHGLHAVPRLRRLLRRLQPQVLHTTLFVSDLWGRVSALGHPVVTLASLVNTPGEPRAHRLSPGAPWKKAVLRVVELFLARHLTDAFHAVSAASKSDAVVRLGVPEHRIRVVYRGRSRQRLGYPSPERRDKARHALGLAPELFVAVAAGRQDAQKGHQVLLKACRQLKDRGSEIVALVAGKEGTETQNLRRLHRELGLDSSVRFLGHREDMGDVLAAADLFVMPSLWEGLPGALLEAMAMGLPVVASALPAFREALPPEGGILVPPGDVEALTQAVLAIAENPTRARTMGEVNLRRFESTFTLERAVAGMAELYRWAATLGP